MLIPLTGACGRGFRSAFHFAAFGNFFTDFNMVPQEGA